MLQRVFRLQWSHGYSAMDTTLAQWEIVILVDPSMEPWLFSHGYVGYTSVACSDRPVPSMEPRLFSHGYRREEV